MTSETRALETAARVVTTTPAYRGICDHCAGDIRGTRTTVTLRHAGRDVTAQVCSACCKAYVRPAPLAADAAARERFRTALIAFRSACPLPAVPTAPTRETWREQHARLRRDLDAVARPRRAVTR